MKTVDLSIFQKEADDFLCANYDIAVFGASNAGDIFYDWLSLYGQERRIRYYLDNDVKKHGMLFCGVPVYSADKLKEDKDITVVIASDFYREITVGLKEQYITNPLFVFDQRLPYCSQRRERITLDVREVYTAYNANDRETRDAIDYCMFLRDKYHGGAVYRMDTKLRTHPLIDYWEAPDLDISAFDNVTIVDAGAYVGDTYQKLDQRYASRIAGYYAFEPNAVNYSRLVRSITENVHLASSPSRNVVAYNAGVSDTSGFVNVSGEALGTVFSLAKQGETPVKTVTIDDTNLEVKGKLCIKMDVEGFEMQALKGAMETIKRFKPELAICVYHKNGDILDVPRFIKSSMPEYNTILRSGSHMVCYASVERYNY